MSGHHICSEVSLPSYNECSDRAKLNHIKTEILDYQDDSFTENQNVNTNFFEFKTEPELLDHMKLEIVDENINCTELKTETTVVDQTDLKYETNTNLREENVDGFKCNNCDHISKTKAALKVHTHVKHLETHACKQCDFVTDTQISLERHVIILHEKPRKFKCPHCSYVATNAYTIQIHENDKHFKKVEFQCDFCPFTTYNKRSMYCHCLVYHRGGATYKCSFCSYSSKRKGNAQQHEKRHLSLHLKQKHCKG